MSNKGEINTTVEGIADAPAADILKQFGFDAPKEAMSGVKVEPLQDATTGKIAGDKPDIVESTTVASGEPSNKTVTVEAPGQLDMGALEAVESATQPEITTPATTVTEEARGKSRDLSGFTAQEQQLLRRMSNETFAWLEPKLKALKETQGLQEKTPPAWMFGHEESYKLLPEYQRHTENMESLNVEEQWWKQQFINLRSGRDAQDLNIDGKGQLIAGGPIGKGADAELYVQQKMQEAVALRSEEASKFANWRASHQQHIGGVRQQMEKVYTTLFGKEVPAPVKAGADKMLGWLPPHLANQTEYKLIAGLYGYVQAAQAQIAALKTQLQGRGVVAAAQAQAGPSQLSGATSGDGVIGENTSVADVMKLISKVGLGR